MSNPHKNLKESAFEEHIENELAKLHKFLKRNTETDYDKVTTFDRELLFKFLRTTQGDKLARLEETYGDTLESRLLCRIDEEISKHGVINILRKGIEEGPVRFDLIFFRPASGLNPEIEKLFQGNIFSVMRQVKFSQASEQSVDLVIFTNGIPIFTAELKNELTGQNVEHAKHQYMTDRDPREKLFSFKRCVAHFAVDTNEVYLTTELKEEKTFFLPFNKGFKNGAGNPLVEGKHKTYYLWEEVWAPEALTDLLQSFVHVYEEIREDRLGKEYRVQVQLFPRYHQWRTVLDLLNDSFKHEVGKNYLIQHSAGSGKSLTIAWLTYRLTELFSCKNEKIYDTIIVLTDRRVLDKQLRNTIKALEATPGILVAAGEDNTRLRDALNSNAKIITTTIQKFPFVQDIVVNLSIKKFAIIIDEAHSSQSGEMRRTVQETLGDYDEEEWLLRQMAARQQPKNISYFAFTATPRHETLERFGEKQPDGSFQPFSLYSMKQAIEEKFILDTLTNYTTYRTYFKLLKKVGEDPTVPRSRALSAILRYVNLHETTLEQKIEIIMAHFEQTIRNMLRGESKAMIVTSSRKAAALYKLTLDNYLCKNNFPYKTLAAFTDSIEIDGQSYTETSINYGVPEEHTAREFKKPDYRFLIVAEKYQTGFDEPFLCAMYVDKRLSRVQAVQTLSRLNRTARDKDQVHVLDFVNEAAEIKEAFEPYYTTTIISEGTDINALNDLRSALFAVYHIEEDVLNGFISPINPDAEEIHERANSFLDDLSRKIINELPHGSSGDVIEEDKYGEFLSISNMYLKRYPYLAQVLGYSDLKHEKLYLLLKYLLKKLPKDPKKPLVEILKYIDLDSVRVIRKIQARIELLSQAGDVRDEEIIPQVPIEEKEDPLSQIINDVNKHWGVDFGPDQQKTLNTMSEELAMDESLQNVVYNNPFPNSELEFKNIFKDKVDDQFDSDEKLWQQLMNNPELNKYIEKKMFRYVADKILALREE
jgi:type I restriction enzyme R subunit